MGGNKVENLIAQAGYRARGERRRKGTPVGVEPKAGDLQSVHKALNPRKIPGVFANGDGCKTLGGVFNPELAEIANHWPTLPQAIRERFSR